MFKCSSRFYKISSIIKKKGGKFKFNETVKNFKFNDKKIDEIITSKKKYQIKKNEIIIKSKLAKILL